VHCEKKPRAGDGRYRHEDNGRLGYLMVRKGL
jgi:hypothetical protein